MDATPSVNDEDVVEASDSEELEILLAERQAAQIQPSLVLRTSSFESGTPRKRRKVFHFNYKLHVLTESQITSAAFFDSNDDAASLSTSAVESAEVPTSSTFSPSENPPRTTDGIAEDSSKGFELDLDNISEPCSQLLHPPGSNFHATNEDIVKDHLADGSQDELDVISQRLTSENLDKSSSDSSQAKSQIIATSSRPLGRGCATFNMRQPSLSPPTTKTYIVNPTVESLFSPDSRRSLLPENRPSSLPPSSPLRTSSIARISPVRTRTVSPSPSQSRRTRSNERAESPRDLSRAELLAMQEEIDISRRYSLRNRRPWQVNPYAYDKQRYKMQMRNNPDAIVKIVSPRRDHANHPHGCDGQDYPKDEYEETQQAVRRRRKGSEPQARQPTKGNSANESSGITKLLLELSDLSEDDLLPLRVDGQDKSSEAQKIIERHRKHRQFPLEEARLRKDISFFREERDSNDQNGKSGISYTRRKAIRPRTHRGMTNRGTEVTSNNPGIHDQVDPPIGPAEGAADRNDVQNLDEPPENSPGMEYGTVVLRNTSPPRGLANTGLSATSGSAEDSDSSHCSEASSCQQNTQGLKFEGKQLKVLGRMMPRVMLAKMLGAQPRNSVNKRPRARSHSIISSGHSNEDEAQSLAPGRSRLVKRSSSQREINEVLGDSESSDQDDGTIPHLAEPSANSDSGDGSTSSASEPDSPADLLAFSDLDENSGYFDNDLTRHQQILTGRREDLIDRMLSRTTTRDKSSGKRISRRSKRPNNPRMDVTVSSKSHPRSIRPHAKQTRLPFTTNVVTTNRSSERDRDAIVLDSPPSSPVSGETDVIQLEQHENDRPAKLSKIQRKEAVLRKNLFTVPAQGKRVGSGRKKGLLRVQIDMADNGFREALAPLSREHRSPVETDRTKHRTEPRLYRRNAQAGLCPQDIEHLKQASLYDFPAFEHAEADDFILQAPSNDLGPLKVSRQVNQDEFQRRFALCSMDMDINPIQIGVAFPHSTYIGKQQLHDLVALIRGDLKPSSPQPYSGFGLIEVSEHMPVAQFSEVLEVASNLLGEWLDESQYSSDDNDFKPQLHLMQVLCLYFTWISSRSDEEEKLQIQASALFCAQQLREKVQSMMDVHHRILDHRTLSVMWFAVEMLSRLLVARQANAPSDIVEWSNSILILLQSLITYGPARTLDSIRQENMDEQSIALRTAELWVCLIHLLCAFERDAVRSSLEGRGLCSFILHIVEKEKLQARADVEVSEHLWRLIFTLNALSQFSVHGNSSSKVHLSASWELVSVALDMIRLTHDPDKDKHRPYESLKKRDKYVRIVVARCYLLATRWHWSLQNSHIMFKKLVVIFKSRMFGNLIGEGADFPAFLRHLDLNLLHVIRGSDSAFSLFLKLLVLTAKAEAPDGEDRQRTQQSLTKLLSLTVPLSGVPFSKRQPPVGDELAMLYNRYSSIIAAIYVDPSEANIRGRLDRARRYLKFSEADERSRRACIRALMYITILLQHLSFSLAEPLNWLEEIAEIVLSEFQVANTGLQSRLGDPQQARKLNQDRNDATLSIQLLIGSVRKILETPTMKGEDVTDSFSYPEVGLLRGVWMKKVFALKDLTNVATTRHEILFLVQAFLRARSKVIPPPPRPSLSSSTSNESQDLYDEFGFDDDVLAALDLGDGAIVIDVNKEHEQTVSDIMNSDIVPAIFRLVLQFFNDPTATSQNEEQLEDYWLNADEWIKCWVGCAAVVVQCGKRSWSHYLIVGPQSWAGISDSSFRRRVALHFMYHLLQYDPTAYKDQDRPFLRVFLECLVSSRITLENDYVALLLSIDGLRHPMLRSLPVHRESEEEDFRLSRFDFTQKRMEIFETIVQNLETNLEKTSSGYDKDLNFVTLSFLDSVVGMVAAMRETWDAQSSAENRDSYSIICSLVFAAIHKYPRVGNTSQLTSLVTWGSRFRNQQL